MGSHRAKALATALALVALPASAIEPGWHISPLKGEGDRASLGCSRDTTDSAYACLAVRCEDDFSIGVHVYTSRLGGDAGRWTVTADREDNAFDTMPLPTPYGSRLSDPEGWLLDRIRNGTFIYLRHADDIHAPHAFIGLEGSFQAIEEALYFCAPRVTPVEQIGAPDVVRDNDMEKRNEPSPVGTQ